MVSDVEHLFMCLLAFRITYLEKCLFSPLLIFTSGRLVFFVCFRISTNFKGLEAATSLFSFVLYDKDCLETVFYHLSGSDEIE